MSEAVGRADAARGADARILAIVAGILDEDGYDAVQLRDVARRSRTSLATIYKRYGNRDDLIVAALQWWMQENRYAKVTRGGRRRGESLHQALMRLFRTIFEPWEDHPGMLAAFYRARSSPGGDRLLHHGLDAVVPAAMEALADVDEAFVADLDAVLSSLVYGLLGRFAAGEIAITDIVATLDRAIRWMTRGYDAESATSNSTCSSVSPRRRNVGS